MENLVKTKLESRHPKYSIVFNLIDGDDNPILSLKANGEIYVKGKLIENDIEVVDAMREFLRYQGFLTYK